MDLKFNEILDLSEQTLLSENLNIKRLGEPLFDSPINFFEDQYSREKIFIDDDEKMLAIIESLKIERLMKENVKIPFFELAGARKKLFFEPGKTKSAIITCGGLCPGLNAVIRGIVMMNYYLYGIK
jgi:hypothetical protein